MLAALIVVAVCFCGLHRVESKAVTLQKNAGHHIGRAADVPVSRPLRKSPGEGGLNGTAFDDFQDFDLSLANITGVAAINISSGDQVDGIQVTYIVANGSNFTTPWRGKISNPPVAITLTPEESVVQIEGKTNGQLVDQMTITTVGPDYERKVFGPFGKTGQVSFSFDGHIVGFHGRQGDLLDRIGVYDLPLLKKSEQFGGSGGDEFDDKSDISTPPIVRIAQIHVWNGELVDAIQVEYYLLGGELVLGKKHGEGRSDNLTTITFDEGEEIITLQGQTGENYVDQLTFITKKPDGSERTYGPFGSIGDNSFSIYGNILGFHGTAGLLIDKIGVYFLEI